MKLQMKIILLKGAYKFQKILLLQEGTLGFRELSMFPKDFLIKLHKEKQSKEKSQNIEK